MFTPDFILILEEKLGIKDRHFSPSQFVFFTGGIVFMTLIVNGSTTQFILHLLHMDKLSVAKVKLCLIF